MLNVNIYIRRPYPFRYDEYQSICVALKRVYGGRPVYLTEWPIAYVSVDGVTLTTARKIADTVRCFHLQAALRDKERGCYGASDTPALLVEVEVRGQGDGRPEWAMAKREDAV